MIRIGLGCIVSFYYYMYIVSSSIWMGIFYFKFKYKGLIFNLFEVFGNKGNKWNKVEVGFGYLDKGKLICVWLCIY